jgi:mannonate dehydratase
MELGLGAFNEIDDDILQFARQIGVPNVIPHSPKLPGDGYWHFEDLLRMRTRVESAGLMLFAIESIPVRFYDKVMQGRLGRDEQIENLRTLIRNVGRAGIHTLGYHWALLGIAYRTEYSPTGRGGAYVTKYDHAQVENAPVADIGSFTEEEVWDNLTYFLEALIPVAEEEGVMLALHPSDPLVESIRGIPHILRSFEAYKRATEIVDSPSNGLKFCQGTVAEWCQTPEEVYEAIRYFASRKKIAYVHFRNVRGVVPTFEETFIDEGKVDMLEAMRAYDVSGYDRVLVVDHTPGIVGDTRWGHRGRAYGIGYMKALMKYVTEG